MSDREALTPRVYIVRHGQTEWAKKGKYTGTTDIKLTEEGVRQVSSMAATLVGPGKYINTSRIAYVFVSPRQRAIQTYKLMLPSSMIAKPKWKVETTEEVAEWNYGKYEGLTTEEIKDLRKSKGLDQKREWSIWKDGCDFDGGESVQDITARMDNLISKIRDIQRPYMNGEGLADVVIFSHGATSRCFVSRWIGQPIDNDVRMMLEPGAVAVLSYKNNDPDQPCVTIGMALPPTKEDRLLNWFVACCIIISLRLLLSPVLNVVASFTGSRHS